MSQPITLTRQIQATDVFYRNFNCKARFPINVGGAGSSKSHSIAQVLIAKFANVPNRKIAICRKTFPSLRLTAYKLVIDLLREYGLYDVHAHDKSHNTIVNPANGAYIAFLSVDDPEKIKSTEWNDIWLEEANEFTWDDWFIIQTRLRAKAPPEYPNKIYFSLNPSDEQGWINQKLMLTQSFAENIEIIHSTYRNNPFLDADYVALLEGLKDQDPNAYSIYAEGKWGVLSNIIYAPYELVQEFPADPDPEIIYGVDFGFNNPTAVLEIRIKDLTHCYLRELLYKTHLTNGQLIDNLKDLIPDENRHRPLYADTAEPNRIQELCDAGFNAYPSDKDVNIGIDFCKRHKFYTLPSNINLNKERAIYKWRQDKNGNVLEEPVKYMDHCLVAGTQVLTSHGEVAIEQVRPGDQVWTRSGWKAVLSSRLTRKNAIVNEYVIDGISLIATESHPVYANGTFKPICQLVEGDTLCVLKPLPQTVGNGAGIQSQQNARIASILKENIRASLPTCIGYFGKSVMALFQRVSTFITRTETLPITDSQILNALTEPTISPAMEEQTIICTQKNTGGIWPPSMTKQRHGIAALKGSNGIDSMGYRSLHPSRYSQSNAGIAVLPTRRQGPDERLNFAIRTVKCVTVGKSWHADVFNLTIAGQPEYFANGILVHNCMDAKRYAIYTHQKQFAGGWNWV